MKIFVCTVLIWSLSDLCVAKTWQIQKDGSGDFAIIQDAVLVATSGDTIAIGPGRYEDFHWDIPGGWSVVRVTGKSLTFMGAGPGESYIGPQEFGEPDSQDVYGIIVFGDGVVTRLQGLTFDNVTSCGVRVENPGRCEVDCCEFRNSYGGFFGRVSYGGWFRDSRFENIHGQSSSALQFFAPTASVVVERCQFVDCTMGIDAYWPECDNITVENCSFDGGQWGIAFTDGASGNIVDCNLQNLTSYAICGNSPGFMRIEDCYVRQVGGAGSCFCAYYPPGTYVLRNNIFEADNVVLWILTPAIDLDARDNHFLRTGPTAWYARPVENQHYSGIPIHLDLTGNWWGTSDPSEVNEWIWDGNDDPDQHYFFDFLPMLDGPVLTEPTTWGAVKSLFR